MRYIDKDKIDNNVCTLKHYKTFRKTISINKYVWKVKTTFIFLIVIFNNIYKERNNFFYIVLINTHVKKVNKKSL